MLPAEVTESVNHAKVVPRSMETQRINEITLTVKERFIE